MPVVALLPLINVFGYIFPSVSTHMTHPCRGFGRSRLGSYTLLALGVLIRMGTKGVRTFRDSLQWHFESLFARNDQFKAQMYRKRCNFEGTLVACSGKRTLCSLHLLNWNLTGHPCCGGMASPTQTLRCATVTAVSLYDLHHDTANVPFLPRGHVIN